MRLRNQVTSNTTPPLATFVAHDFRSGRRVVRVEERRMLATPALACGTQFVLRGKARAWVLVGATSTGKSWAHECGAFNIRVRNKKSLGDGSTACPGFQYATGDHPLACAHRHQFVFQKDKHFVVRSAPTHRAKRMSR